MDTSLQTCSSSLTGNPTIVQFEIPNCLINATNTTTTSPQIMFEFERYYPFQKKNKHCRFKISGFSAGIDNAEIN